MNEAENALSKARPANEPLWIRFFTYEQLYAEFMYAADKLSHTAKVQQFAPTVLAAKDGMRRRRVLASAAFASTYATPGKEGVDVERACVVLGEVLPAAGALTSMRSMGAVNRVRRKLVPYAQHPAVVEFETKFRAVVGAST